MRARQNIQLLLTGAVFCLSALIGAPAFAYKLFVDHPSSYSSGDCHYQSNDGCGDVTGPIRGGLHDFGWDVSNFWTGGDAWASDFIDCSITSGEDCYNADGADAAIFDGHGNTGELGFAYKHNGFCKAYASQTDLSGTAAIFISTACCYMKLSAAYNFTEHNGLNQQLGFGNEASMDDGSIGEFWTATGGIPWNVSGGSNMAWLDKLEDKTGWWTGDNTTVVFTRGSDLTDVANNRNNCGLRRGTCWARKGYYVGSAWQYDYKDHGSDGCG
jgi:hypothetical protein